MHESKYSGSDYFYVLWLCVKGYTGKELTHQNTQGLNMLYSWWRFWSGGVATTVALLRRRQREGRAVAVVGIPRSCRGRDVHTVVELKSSSGYVQRCRGGRHGSSCAVLTGQEGSGVGLKKRSDNQHVVGGGVCQGAGVGGGTASSRVDVFVQQ